MTADRQTLIRFTLPNGLRCVCWPNASRVVHLGVMTQAGARDEQPNLFGAAHFIEHMLFKGTQKRKSYHINSRLDDVGGELNAYTTKEQTFLYAVVLKEHTTRAAELLSDMLLNATFPEKEMEKEREVILDEIRSCKDDPSDEMMEWGDEVRFANHPLAHPILGTVDTVKGMQRQQLLDFRKKHYVASQMVVTLIGPFTEASSRSLMMRYFSQIPSGEQTQRPLVPIPYQPQQLTKVRELNNAHGLLVGPAYGLHHSKRLGFFMLNNILGGPAMNSRLNLHIRERHGLTYFLESGYAAYQDEGAWYIYFSTDAGQMNRTLDLIHRELKVLREKALGSLQWTKALHQIKGQIALANESSSHLLHVFARSVLMFDEVETTAQLFSRLDALQPSDLVDMAEEVFQPDQLSLLQFLPSQTD